MVPTVYNGPLSSRRRHCQSQRSPTIPPPPAPRHHLGRGLQRYRQQQQRSFFLGVLSSDHQQYVQLHVDPGRFGYRRRCQLSHCRKRPRPSSVVNSTHTDDPGGDGFDTFTPIRQLLHIICTRQYPGLHSVFRAVGIDWPQSVLSNLGGRRNTNRRPLTRRRSRFCLSRTELHSRDWRIINTGTVPSSK